jgi:long-chain acyl-CoA synthetase
MQLSLASILAESALRHRDRVAAIEGRCRATYGELWNGALERAAALERLGVEPGDRVALLASNGIDFVTAYFGILARGAVVVPIPPMLVADEIAFMLEDSGAALALAERGFVPVLAVAVERAGTRVVVLRDGTPDDLAERARHAQAPVAAVPREPLETAVLFYTSGTTGRPKGAVLTHVNLVMNCFVNAFMANEFQPDDVVLGCLPLFHTFGQTVALNSTFLAGATVVLQPRFDGADALALMREHAVDVLIGVPTMYIALLSALGAEEDAAAPGDAGAVRAPALRMAICGGAPLPVAVLEAFEARFGVRVQEGYGLSETSPTATVNQKAFGQRPGSIGHPLWGIEAEIARAEVEDRIELLGPDELGEIVIRGHNVFAGYHGLPEATSAALVEGWFRTGDLGVKDPDGFRYVVDRKKDMILRGGYNVYPREIEEVLARHPGVAQVAVVGVPHPTHGEEVLAVVVPEPAAEPGAPPPLEADALLAWARERIAHHKRPRLVAFADELPLGPSRKVLKRELRERYAELAQE